jgi:Membrane proteins related to metalloendopeptidases
MGYMHPFPRNTRRSQKFGDSPGWVLNGVQVNPAGGHTGEDSAVPNGTPVHAAGDGVIDAATVFPNYNNEWLLGPFGGRTIVLDCGDNAPSFVYAHLSRYAVSKGQHVKKGQIIGYSGNSGSASTGYHCHTECLPPNWNTHNGTYGRVDPRKYMTEFPDEMEDEMPAPTAKEIAAEILNTRHERAGGIGGTLSLAEMVMWYDANLLAAPGNVWSYTNTAIGETRDAYEILRERTQVIAASIPDEIAQDVIDALSERLNKA